MLLLEKRPIERGVGGHLLEFRARPGSPQGPVLHWHRGRRLNPGQEGNLTGLPVVVWHRSLEGLGLLVEVVRRRHVMLRLLALLLGLVLLKECCPRAAVRRFGAICVEVKRVFEAS